MFYYYGRKKAHAKRYPQPEHDTIVEPFAGAAAYSLHGDNWRRQVILYDTSARVCRIWRYLIQATTADIQELPEPSPGAILADYQSLAPEERELIGMHAAIGKPTPRNVVGEFNRWGPGKRYILDNLHKVKHWQVREANYLTCRIARAATWFIDPPYQHSGRRYPGQHKLDYIQLAEWCRQRKGLVIVCGGARDGWLPFDPLCQTKSPGLAMSEERVFVLCEGKQLPPPFPGKTAGSQRPRRQPSAPTV